MKFSYYTTVQSAWDAIYEDCRQAERSIRFEQFILRDFKPGDIGDRFVQLFIKKAKEGVRVRVLLDVVGSYNIVHAKCLREMQKAGVEVKFISIQFGRIRDILDWTPRRNHRKLAVIDDEVAYIGGVVFSNQVQHWNDFHVRIEGDSRMFRKAFELVWSDQKTRSTAQLRSGHVGAPFSLIFNEHANNVLYEVLCRRIKQAKKEILIITPYFSPGRHLRNLLIKAAKRGVKVTIVIPQQSDNAFSQMAHVSYIPFARRANIAMIAAEKMNHAKIVKIDDWLTFGSGNFDRLSLFYNKELNVQTRDQAIINEINKVALEPFSEGTISFSVFAKQRYRNPIRRFLYGVLGYMLRPLI